MKVWPQFAIWSICLATVTVAHGGEIVDRVVANVNGHVLLQSDWEEELALEGLINIRALDSFTLAERKAALDRLIDQELLREQVRPPDVVPADQLAVRLTEIRKLYAEGATEEGWRSVLGRYGLTESILEKRVGNNLQLMRLVDAKLRPSLQIDEKAVETYYHEQLLPELKKTGGKEVALAEVIGKIRDLLVEQKFNQLLSNWLASLRSEGHIETRESAPGDQSR